MKEKQLPPLGPLPDDLQFITDSGLTTLQETQSFLIQKEQEKQLRLLAEKGVITRKEAVNVLLAHLQDWLEQRGIDITESSEKSADLTLQRNFESFLFGGGSQ
ncbi:hypothetical protein V6x_07320 [Gimesia chilikensis]|uniref:Uncharacterized protein n=1 Tax=Gimesia chilikensis TaxID=2605989 RepID=A0A517W724_9PLAN|nr:hypothetical protein [Gimesia chilikensis]QDU01054.1 hypothetical protein V6x_07320 [Gimesia chilikensis]